MDLISILTFTWVVFPESQLLQFHLILHSHTIFVRRSFSFVIVLEQVLKNAGDVLKAEGALNCVTHEITAKEFEDEQAISADALAESRSSADVRTNS